MSPQPQVAELPRLHPFVGTDVWKLLLDRADEFGDERFLTWQDFEQQPQSWSYAEFRDKALRVAAGLAERGVVAGDRVVIHLENCPEFLLAWFGCAALHAVAVTTNVRSSLDELAFYIADSGAIAAVTRAGLAEIVDDAGPDLLWVAVVGGDNDRQRMVRFDDLDADARSVVLPLPDPSAPLSIQYTSGTTSRPKGVLWTHANGLWAARVNASHEGLRPDDVHLVYMPLFHTNALGYSVLPTLWVGARFVLIPKWSTSRFWAISVMHGCTWLSMMPLSARALLRADPPPHHSYRAVAGLTNPVFKARLGVESIAWWGMTETISHGIYSDGQCAEIENNIGRVAPEYDIKVVCPDGEPADPGETGELFVRGVRGLSMFAYYWHNPDATAASFDEAGWFATGDLVRFNADGTFSFMDRAKDMLKVGAENVAASEIERVISDVVGFNEVAVVAKPDEKLDEVPIGFVVAVDAPADLAERVLAACRERLADFKVPHKIHVVRALPHSTINKINKAELRRFAAGSEQIDEAEQRWLTASASDPSSDAGV
jgi:carnitine-CoA ligase